MSNQRITVMMTTRDALAAIVDGNPGALRACCELMKHVESIDPDLCGGQVHVLFALDALGIYGPRIWMLFSDVCGTDPGKVLALIRAYQFGQLAGVTLEALQHAIDHRGVGLDLDAAVAAVQAKLPRFRVDAWKPTAPPAPVE